MGCAASPPRGLAVLPEQTALRRSGRVRPQSVPRARRARPRRGGVLRPTLGRGGEVELESPSLDLYREPDPFRTPHWREYRDTIDLLEIGTMWTGGFAEPLTFSLRAARLLERRLNEFDVVHDNQSLGYGLLSLTRRGIPLVATIHHPITVDRRLELEGSAKSAAAHVAATLVRLPPHAGTSRATNQPDSRRVRRFGGGYHPRLRRSRKLSTDRARRSGHDTLPAASRRARARSHRRDKQRVTAGSKACGCSSRPWQFFCNHEVELVVVGKTSAQRSRRRCDHGPGTREQGAIRDRPTGSDPCPADRKCRGSRRTEPL